MALKQTNTKTAAEKLSEETERPVEEFEPDFEETPIPDASEQCWESTDEE